jgi:mono/diheme cytochrome c family protein
MIGATRHLPRGVPQTGQAGFPPARTEARASTMKKNRKRLQAAARAILIVAGCLLTLPNGTASAQDQARAAAGERVYNINCSACHGSRLVNSGESFDLRRLAADQRPRFEDSVLNGKNRMPPWRGYLKDAEIDQIWHYIRSVNDG